MKDGIEEEERQGQQAEEPAVEVPSGKSRARPALPGRRGEKLPEPERYSEPA